MNAIVNYKLVGIITIVLVIAMRLFLISNTFGDASFSRAFNIITVWLLFIIMLIMVMVEPIVAIKIIHKNKRKLLD